MMKTLILDNYDSFTYNLYQYVAELGGNPIVKKNDEISLADIKKIKPTHIIISPGPGTPVKKKYFGICSSVIKKYMGKLPILGVCLGCQGTIHVLGGRIICAPLPVHGKTSWVRVVRRKIGRGTRVKSCKAPNLFHKLPKRMKAMRYHSLICEKKSFPKELVITAETEKDNLIMAFQHKRFPLWGLQFHPESIETPQGKLILRNFLRTVI